MTALSSDPLLVAVEATFARLRSLEDAERQQAIRASAYRDLSGFGLSQRAISEAMESALLERGATPEQVEAAGISHYNIGLLLKTFPGDATV